MDVEITTSDPREVDPAEVAEALTKAGYYVYSVKVLDRANFLHAEWRDDD